MRKRFNTTGPCNPAWHYMVPPLARLPEAVELVEQGDYFVIHAPRQTGKTTFLESMAAQLTRERGFAALYASCEIAEAHGDDVDAAQAAVVQSIAMQAEVAFPPSCGRPIRARPSRRPTSGSSW